MKILVLTFFMLSASLAQTYDGELLEYYSENRADVNLIKKKLEKNLGESSNKNTSERILIASAKNYQYTVQESASGSRIGLFVVHDLGSKAFPFIHVFTDNDVTLPENKPLFGSFGEQLEMLDCEVLELFEAKVTSNNLTSISNIKSIKHLGLPVRGIGFSKGVKIPVSLESLVVRNGYLNEPFFAALNDLSSIKKLVILDCGFEYGSPQDPNVVYTPKSWAAYPRLFDKVSETVEELKLVDSDPSIFNHIVRENWPKLKKLSISLHPANFKAVNYLILDGKGMLAQFPALSELTIKEYGVSYQNLKNAAAGVTVNFVPNK